MALQMPPQGAGQGRLAPAPERYPSPDEIPEVAADGAKEKMGDQVGTEMNPVLDALTVLQKYVMAAEGKGDPNAGALKEHLVEFVRTMAGSGGGEAAPTEEGAMPQEGAAPESSPDDEMSQGVPQEGAMPEDEMEGEPMRPKKRKLNPRLGQAVPMI